MRLCCVPLIKDRSGDFCGMGLVVYELAGKLSRAFSSSALAACIIAADVFGRVVRLGEPGFNGSGGGARSGSELSHLKRRVSLICYACLHPEAHGTGDVHWYRGKRMRVPDQLAVARVFPVNRRHCVWCEVRTRGPKLAVLECTVGSQLGAMCQSYCPVLCVRMLASFSGPARRGI